MEQRLINAYVLKEKLDELGWTIENRFEKRIYLDDIIDNIPTAETEEEVAYWEAPDPDYDRDGARLPNLVAICSNCQKPAKLPRTRYCPNCGRRMILGED